MYSPDGFASLACALQGQCWFLSYQQPFIWIMRQLNGSIELFFALQITLWLTLIFLIYVLSKEMGLKHLFLTPLILLYSGTFFIDNFVGSLENDAIGIICILLAMIFYVRYKNKDVRLLKKNINNLLMSIVMLGYSLSYWMWIGYLFKTPKLYSTIVEEIFWAHWVSWLFLFPIIILAIMQTIKYRKKINFVMLIGILIIPKLLILVTIILLRFIDGILDKMLLEPNKKQWIALIVFCLLVGQFARVTINTNESWNREITNEQCVTVDDEYFLRATKGLNYTYNQLNTQEVEKCKNKT